MKLQDQKRKSLTLAFYHDAPENEKIIETYEVQEVGTQIEITSLCQRKETRRIEKNYFLTLTVPSKQI